MSGNFFSTKQVLKKHIHEIHESLRDHKWALCNKLFPRKGHVNEHIHRVHEKQKKSSMFEM